MKNICIMKGGFDMNVLKGEEIKYVEQDNENTQYMYLISHINFLESQVKFYKKVMRVLFLLIILQTLFNAFQFV